ncbi:MAG: hypothetical protein ABJF89_10100 [Parasphingorhabdus sp.]|uniref:DUF7710 domain-containing protein n=1 Tax=Parasphingorhabdus sp. TaxID=2709688 RepID=UPI003267ED98
MSVSGAKADVRFFPFWIRIGEALCYSALMEHVWIFHGQDADFASAVFAKRADAETWINENHFSGVLTIYPVDKPIYDWAVEKEFFRPDLDHPKTGKFIQNFTSASQEHFHYENGVLD